MSYIHELFSWIRTPAKVIQLLIIVGILQSSLACACGQIAVPETCPKSKYPDEYCFCCTNCGNKSSIRTHSVFYKVKKSLPDLVTLIWACAVLDESVCLSFVYKSKQKLYFIFSLDLATGIIRNRSN